MWVTAVTLCPEVHWDIQGHTIHTWIEGACRQIEQTDTPLRQFLVTHLRPLALSIPMPKAATDGWYDGTVPDGTIEALSTAAANGDERDRVQSDHHPNTWDESRVFDRIMTEEYDALLLEHLNRLGLPVGRKEVRDDGGSAPIETPFPTDDYLLLDLRRVRSLCTHTNGVHASMEGTARGSLRYPKTIGTPPLPGTGVHVRSGKGPLVRAVCGRRVQCRHTGARRPCHRSCLHGRATERMPGAAGGQPCREEGRDLRSPLTHRVHRGEGLPTMSADPVSTSPEERRRHRPEPRTPRRYPGPRASGRGPG